MEGEPNNNALVLQSGGVTAVINASLAGVAQEAIGQEAIGKLFGAAHGLEGLLEERFLDLSRQPSGTWARVARTPGAALGSGRRRLRPEETDAVLQIFARHRITYLFSIGGNDSAEAAHRLALAAGDRGQPLRVIGVPKTVDNDLPETDHCPGYGSAARFVAMAAMGQARDAESMGKAAPVTILEVMGRNAGWLAAAAALGRREERDGPHFIAFPESGFDEDAFMARIEEAYARWGFALAVVNENLKDGEGPLGHRGEPLYIDDFGHAYYQSPAQYLAGRLSRRLGVRVRHEKPGTIQRSLAACTSNVDAAEALLVGRTAVRYAVEGHTDVMVTLVRETGSRYRCGTGMAPLEAIANQERVMPPEFFDADAGQVTGAFLEYARPLIGPPLPRFGRLKGR